MISENDNFTILGLRRSFSAWDPPMNDIFFGQDTRLNIFVQVFLGDTGNDLVACSESLAHFEDEGLKERNIDSLRLSCWKLRDIKASF